MPSFETAVHYPPVKIRVAAGPHVTLDQLVAPSAVLQIQFAAILDPL
jgi:hypothetical protein